MFSHPQEAQLPLDIATASACLMRAGCRVAVIDQWARETGRNRLHRELLETEPHVLVVLLDSLNLNATLERIRDVPWPEGQVPHLVAMGQYAEVFPERLLKPNGLFDSCVVGEPEHTLVDLSDCLKDGDDRSAVQGLVWTEQGSNRVVRNHERSLIEDLDSLPFPAYEVFDLDAYSKQSSFVRVPGRIRWGWVLSSRGCPFDCVFCSPTLRKSCGRKYRVHSPTYVSDQVEELINVHGCNAIAFEDDVFSLSRQRTLAICDEFMRRGLRIPWTAETHLGTLDEDVIRRMKRAECHGICAGVEAGDDDVRDQIKGGSLDRQVLLRNVRLLHENDINLTLYFMIGSPGETRQQMLRTMDLALELDPMTIQLAYFTPYPGSRAWEEHVKGNDEDSNGTEISHYNRFDRNLSAVPRNEVMRLYRRFYRRFYLRPGYLRRYSGRRLSFTFRQDWRRESLLLARSLAFLLMPVRSVRLPWISSRGETK